MPPNFMSRSTVIWTSFCINCWFWERQASHRKNAFFKLLRKFIEIGQYAIPNVLILLNMHPFIVTVSTSNLFWHIGICSSIVFMHFTLIVCMCMPMSLSIPSPTESLTIRSLYQNTEPKIKQTTFLACFNIPIWQYEVPFYSILD